MNGPSWQATGTMEVPLESLEPESRAQKCHKPAAKPTAEEILRGRHDLRHKASRQRQKMKELRVQICIPSRGRLPR